MRAGSHEVQVFGGGFVGGMAYANDKTVPPLIAEPARMRIELDSGTSFGIGYSYQVHENWLIGGTLTRVASEFAFEVPFDRAAEEELLLTRTVTTPSQGTALTEQQKLDLLDRVEAHSRPRDVDLTLLDLSAVYLLNPEGPWTGEFGAGLGFSSSSADDDPMVWEMLFRNDCDPTDSNCVITVANEPNDPTGGTGCPAGDDPCDVLETSSNLSWHVLAGLRYAFSDSVQVRAGLKLRLLEAVTDPGDSFVSSEGTLGVVFRFGGN